jgi:hypothetical protein
MTYLGALALSSCHVAGNVSDGGRPGSGGVDAGSGGSGTGGIAGTGGTAGGEGGGGDRSAGGASGAGGRPGEGTGGAAGGMACLVPERQGEQATSIEGTWTFTPTGGSATTITVPGGGWVAQGMGRITGGRYARSITVPNLDRSQVTLVEFGAINHQATLAIDGRAVGTNTTSFTPSVFDVSAVVTPGMSHALTVDVLGRNAPALRAPPVTGGPTAGRKLVPDGAEWSPNIAQGIYRSAIVRAVPQVHVADVFVRPDLAGNRVSVDVTIANGGPAAATANVAVSLQSWNCDPWTYPVLPPMSVSVPAGQTMKVTVGPVTWGLGPASYWWPNVPYRSGYRAKLHYAVVSVTGPSGLAHTRAVRFGFRDIKQVGTHYELSGVRVNFRGDSLQGANYDSITSDAYDVLPGFLPPSAGNGGWPQAIDNYQRLNYDVARIHQIPASPYMLDVADELGFMIIDESAIRGTSGDEDFVAGLANMVGHVRALVLRDRNHPSVIRWSQCNEPEYDPTSSPAFEQSLYDAITGADPTRPVSADSGFNGASYDRGFVGGGVTLTTNPNFSVYGHYPGGAGMYTEAAMASTTRPFGLGELIWPKDNTRQGLAWFATATMALRRQDASEIRPYTLLSGWASFVPGVSHASMTIEQGGNPLFGEDNLPSPWTSPLIVRIQRANSPLLVADLAYWNANRMSNPNGDWPSVTETVARGSQLNRTLMVFNDTFAGTTVDVAWEMRADSATGAISSQGQMSLQVPLGNRVQAAISATAPQVGTTAYLILRASKDGMELFRDDGEVLQLQ